MSRGTIGVHLVTRVIHNNLAQVKRQMTHYHIPRLLCNNLSEALKWYRFSKMASDVLRYDVYIHLLSRIQLCKG